MAPKLGPFFCSRVLTVSSLLFFIYSACPRVSSRNKAPHFSLKVTVVSHCWPHCWPHCWSHCWSHCWYHCWYPSSFFQFVIQRINALYDFFFNNLPVVLERSVRFFVFNEIVKRNSRTPHEIHERIGKEPHYNSNEYLLLSKKYSRQNGQYHSHALQLWWDKT